MKGGKKALIIIVILVLTAILINRWQQLKTLNDEQRVVNRGFDRRVSLITYTPVATCQMDCYQIGQTDIEEIVRTGEINYAKSNTAAKPCPTYALQVYNAQKEFIRVVFEQCESETRVLAVYNLDKDLSCNCNSEEQKK